MSALELAVEHRFESLELSVALRIPMQGVTAVLGHSGAGKSTLLAVLAGIFTPQQGRVAVAEDVLLDTQRGIRRPPEARHFGVVLQRPALFPHLTVRDNLAYGARRRSKDMPVKAMADIVNLLELQPLLARFPRHLSGGEQQRVALARALLSQPRLLLLDEPLAAVDPARRNEVLPYLERLCQDAQVPVVYVSHSVDDVARLADHVIVLDHGRVQTQGATHEVLSDVDAFGVRDVVNVIEGELAHYDGDASLATLLFDGGQIILPRVTATRSDSRRGRCLLRAKDIMLSTSELTGVSAHNVLPVVIERLDHDDAGSARVALRCGGSLLAARITQASLQRLDLQVGQTIFAVFKAEHLRTQVY